MIIDDDPDSSEILSEDLSGAGYNTLIAGSGEEGVEMAIEWKPDLILMDVLMPGLYGSEAAELIYANNSTTDIPVIFLSGILDRTGNGSHDSVYTVHGRKYHALPKGIEKSEFLSEIQKYLTPQGTR